MKMPTASEFRRGCLAYEKNERDSMYKVASFLVKKFWGHPADMADGLGVLLLTWNNAFYRYGQFCFEELEKCIKNNWAFIEEYHRRDISSHIPDDDEAIQRLFKAFLQALRIAYGKNAGRRSPVSVAKALHLLAPRFFPLWDEKIARAYGCIYARNPEKRYISFCRTAKEMASVLASHVHRKDRPLLKLIDEYNYARYTKPWAS